MTQISAIDASRQFLNAVWQGKTPSDATLAAALDRLLVAYHDAPDTGPSDAALQAPRQDGPSLYRQTAARFPDYGLYPVADPAGQPGEPAMVGDAIDDLADITLDMRELIWLADNATPDDACWSFRLGYSHWGRHARELALYLHARRG